MRHIHAALILSLCTALAGAQQASLSWVADADAPTPADLVVMRGETVLLSARLTQSGAPLSPAAGSSASLYWQTNGMDSAWWTAPATIRSNVLSASWAPSNDCGAALYTLFLGASGPSGALYRASARLRVRHAPGASPNALALPVPALDFASISTTNAAWLELPAWYSGSNALAGALAAESSDRVAADSARPTYTSSTNIAAAVVSASATAAFSNAVAAADSWLVVSNGTLSVWASTNPPAPASRLWASSESSGGAPDAAATNAIWAAIRSLAAAIPDGASAWSDYDAIGNPNPDGEITLLNRASTAFAGGMRIETSGAYGVLASDGTVAFLAGTNGSMRIGPDSTNTFGYVQGGTVTVGANAGTFHYDAGTHTASISYYYSGSGDYPAIFYSASLSSPVWSEVSGCVWTYSAGASSASVVVPAPDPSGYFKATTSSTSANYFYSSMPARFDGGVFGSASELPVRYDSVITISSGGASYRIPAELVP